MGFLNKGSNTSTTTSTPNAAALAQYNTLLGRAAGVASTPYAGYTGQEVAPVNEQQTAGIGNINTAAGMAGNNIADASNMIRTSSAPITSADINSYLNPYTQDVVNATEAQFAHDNAVQQSQVQGNAAAASALGGNRLGVAQANTAEAQNRQQNPVIAGLYSKGFDTALGAAENQQRTGLAGAGQLAGVANNYLPTAQAQVAGGTLEQQTAQAADTAAMQDYFRQQAYPFQTTQWLAGIDTGVGSNMGGTSSTQGPTPNPWAQAAGLGLSAAAAFAKDGGRITKAGGGGLSGDGPWAGVQGWVPTMSITGGHGAPNAPSTPQQQGLNKDQLKGVGALAKSASDWWNDDSDSSKSVQDASDFTGDATSAHSLYNRGGRIHKDAGGSLTNYSLPWLDDSVDQVRDYVPTSVGFSGSAEPAGASFQDRWDAAPQKDYSPQAVEDRNMLQTAGGFSDSPAVQEKLQAGLRTPPERMPETREASNVIPLPRRRPEDADIPADIQSQPGVQAINKGLGANDNDEEGQQALAYDQPQRLAAGAGPGAGVYAPPSYRSEVDRGEASPLAGLASRLGFHVSPALRQGLMQAGLAMMATNRGGPGSFLGAAGDAGFAGIAGYNSELEGERKNRLEAEKVRRDREKDQLERERFERPYQQMTAAQAAANKLASEREKWQFKEGDGLTTPDRAFNGATGEIKELPPGTVKAMGPAATPLGAQPAQQAAGAPSAAGQPVQYAITAPPLQKGDQVPEPAPVPGHSPASLKTDAETFLTGGPLPKASANPRNSLAKQDVNYQRAVKNYAIALAQSRGLSENDIADIRRFAPQGARFVLSQQGNQTVALGTAIRHLDSVRDFAKAWIEARGVDTPILRQAKARFAQAWGSEEPTNLAAAVRIAAPETLKAIGVAGAGTGHERIAQENGFSPEAGEKQILGAIDVAQTFLAGQLPAKEAQANAIYFPHDKFVKMVGEEEYKKLQHLRSATPATKQLAPADQQALDWANDPKNAKDPRAVAIKKKLGVQ